MGILGNGEAVISFPTSKVTITGFATASARERGVTKVTLQLEVRDPWELADLTRSVAEIREANPNRRFKI